MAHVAMVRGTHQKLRVSILIERWNLMGSRVLICEGDGPMFGGDQHLDP